MYHFFVDIPGETSETIDRFLVVELATGETLRQLFERIYKEIAVEERNQATIIVRPPVKYPFEPSLLERLGTDLEDTELPERPSILRELKTEPVARTFSRFDDTPVRILHSHDFQHVLSSNINPLSQRPCSHTSTDRLMLAIRDAELDSLVEKGKCKLPPLDSHYYQAPSNRYVRSFLRVGSLQISRAAIDAIFFWLLPYLRECAGVITDTWSISSISQNISRRLVEYDPASRTPCPIEMLGDYHHEEETYGAQAADIIDQFLTRISGNGAREGAILILISATHTGSMEAIVRTQLDKRQIPADRVRFVSLFRLSNQSSIPALRDYSDVDDFRPVETPLTQQEAEAAIRIDGMVYFPLAEIDVETGKTLDAVKSYRGFASAYSDVPFSRVHYTDVTSNPGRTRHHMVWLDTELILRHPTFIDRFEAKLAQLSPQPSVIISPTHTAGQALAALAQQYLSRCGKAVKVFAHDDLKLDILLIPEEQELYAQLRAAGRSDSILILDDVFITGVKLSVYQKNLRDAGCKAVLHALVGIARPHHEDLWKRSKSSFERALGPSSEYARHPNTFDYVEFLVLPNWNESSCPWCLDAKALKDNPYSIELPWSANERPDGLTDQIFAVPNKSNPLRLRAGSFFGPETMSEASLFCLVAGMLQTMRTKRFKDEPLLGTKRYLVSVVLAQSVYRQNYTDSILIASLFRALTNAEFVYRRKAAEADRGRSIEEFLLDPCNDDLIAEFIIACCKGLFPTINLASANWKDRLVDLGLVKPID